MLHEIKNVKQEPGAGPRRWFESDALELVVWYAAAGQITGFQLCYQRRDGEHALTWRAGAGFAHAAVDSGDESPLKNQTPILTPESDVPWHEIARLFDRESADLEPALRQLVHDKLAEREGASAS
ncbi:MAG TPA: hypothetical protein VM029_13380 [Opitutaceae bacterium]|nr:hypothetical protein [Opitutaceae bacterium]